MIHWPHRICCFAVLAAAVLNSSHFARAGEPVAFRWENNAETGHADLFRGDHPVLRYVYTVDTSTPEHAFDTAKVFHHVFAPGGDTLLTKGPGGLYPHHRGLYVGWNKTSFADEGGQRQTNDFWHCKQGETIRHVEFLAMEANSDAAHMTARLHWLDREGKLVIEETRTVAVRAFQPGPDRTHGWQIDWQTKLDSRRGTITLDGDRQHAGFQYRAAQDVAEKNSARYIRPEGFPQQPEAHQVNDGTDPDKHVNLPWLAMTYPLDGEKYTVEYHEAPSLPKPSRYSERPYGRFGAFFQAELEEDGEPLEMHYRLHITAGEPPTPQQIRQRNEAFHTELALERVHSES